MTSSPEALLPPFIDSTMMNAFRVCPQKFFSEFVLGLRPAEKSVDLHAGACFSSALEETYRNFFERGLGFESSLVRAYARFEHEWGDFTTTKKTPKTREAVWEGVEEYFKKWRPDGDPVQPFRVEGRPSVEFSFAIPLEPVEHELSPAPYFPLHPVTREPWLYVGRFDMLGLHDSTVAVRDEKTGSRLESNWTEKWDLRSQFLGYCWALQHEGIRCSKAVVRGIIFYLQKQPALVEAIKIYPNFLLERWHEQLRRDLWRLTRMWEEHQLTGRPFDFDLGDSCTNYGGCPFKDRCSSKDINTFNSSYEVRRWNPLAKDPTGGPKGPDPTTVALSATSPSTPIGAARPFAGIASLGIPFPPSSAAVEMPNPSRT